MEKLKYLAVSNGASITHNNSKKSFIASQECFINKIKLTNND